MAFTLISKLLRATGALWIVVTLTFIGLRLTGDPALAMLPPDSPPGVFDAYSERWGLDRPLYEQYFHYIGNVLTGDYGLSYRDKRPALDVVSERLPKTLLLMGATLVVMLVAGLLFGIVGALSRGRLLDRVTMTFAVTCYSLPNFFLGVLLILVFAVQLRLLPTSGSGSLRHMILPVLTMGLSWAGVLARFTRSAVLDTLRQPYILAAAARGLSRTDVISRHAMPNAALPIVTVLGLTVGGMIGGAIVTEAVFAWPGIGRLLVISVERRDLPVVQAIVLLIAFSMVVTNLVVDLLYGWIDPRVHLSPGRR